MKMKYCRLAPGESGHDAGRRLLEELYREATGEPLPPILQTRRGKPYFEDSAYHFSITHTRRHVFCALSEMPIGIDAEELDRRVNLSLAEKVLSPGEKTQFDQSRDKNRALLTFWVLKEAAAKHTGEGLRGYPNNTEFSLEDDRVIEVDGCLVAIVGCASTITQP